MFTRTRSTALILALCSTVAVLAGCTRSATGSAEPGPAAQASPELGRFYDQQLAWGPCFDFATGVEDRRASEPFDCAGLEVPLDYAAPDGVTAQIAVLRQRATGRSEQRIGSLLFNPGGPGGSGTSAVASLADDLGESPIARRFDLIGFDPRGVGASTPAIDCLDDAEWEVERADLDLDPSPAGVEQTEDENRQYAERCTERSGGAEVLANAGTRDVVRDVDILRAALGDDKLSFVGYSYGTKIGSEYAEAFPQNVRALVLDGAVDPTQTFADWSTDQMAGFQLAFEAFAADCARRGSCPLGTDPAQATAAFQALTRPLIEKPLQVDDRTLSYTDAVTGTTQALYAQDFWPDLTRGISELAAGNGETLLYLSDLYHTRDDDGVYDDSNDAFVAISCVDEDRITDRAVVADLNRRVAEAAPFSDDGRDDVAALGPCAFWPAPTTSEPHVPQVDGLPRTLVVSTTGDPATPYQAGVDLAAALKGSLLTFEGTQHTVVLEGKACVDDVVTAYLIYLQLPDGEVRCAA